MSIVVSDTSPTRALHHIAQLDLLHRLFGDVVPPAVVSELLRPRGHFAPVDVTKYPFLSVRTPTDPSVAARFRNTLDAGEAEAIALAIELSASALLIDETAGRAAAAAAGIPYIGVLGVFSRAKRAGYIAQVRPLVDRLRGELKFRMNDSLYERYVRSIGEW